MKLNKLFNKPVKDTQVELLVIFIHGNSMNASFFKNQLNDKLLSQYNLASIDLPGHGKSSKLDNYSISNLTDAIYESFKAFENIVLVGHSLGGHIAIQLLPKFKEKCKGILVFGTSPLKLPLNVDEAYNIDEDSAKFLQKDINEQERKKLASIIYPYEDEVFTNILKSFETTVSKFREDFANALVSEEMLDEIEVLKDFKGKVMFVNGKNDGIVNKTYITSLANTYLVDANHTILKGIGHSPHLEDPDVFNKTLLDFIEQLF